METTEGKLELHRECRVFEYELKAPFDEIVGFGGVHFLLTLRFAKENEQWGFDIAVISVHIAEVCHFLCKNNHLNYFDDKTTTDAVQDVVRGAFGEGNGTRWKTTGDFILSLMLFKDDLERLSGKSLKNNFDRDTADVIAKGAMRYVKQLLDTADSAVRKWASKNEWAKEKTNEVVQD